MGAAMFIQQNSNNKSQLHLHIHIMLNTVSYTYLWHIHIMLNTVSYTYLWHIHIMLNTGVHMPMAYTYAKQCHTHVYGVYIC